MVTSITALRTHIKQIYNVSAVKVIHETQEVLYVPITREQCKPEDIILYQCVPHTQGTLFILPQMASLGQKIYCKPLPTTYAAFCAACARAGIEVLRTEDKKMCVPPASCKGIPIPKVACDYTELTIQIPADYDATMLLSMNTWIQSQNDEHRYKVLLRTSTQKKRNTLNHLNDLLRLLVSMYDCLKEGSSDKEAEKLFNEASKWGDWEDIRAQIMSDRGFI